MYFFPAAGRRLWRDGTTAFRGSVGRYWPLSSSSGYFAWSVSFSGGSADITTSERSIGYSIRCVAQGSRNYNCFGCSFILLPS